jgi:hypothetical protein
MTTVVRVTSSADWRGDRLTDDPAWRMLLNDTHRAEVLTALAAVEAADVQLDDVRREVFPLPTLSEQLRRVADEVARGRGFALVQGVPVEGLAEQQSALVALGVASHVGTPVSQGPKQGAVVDVRDEGADPAHSTTRSYQHSRHLGFHADPTDAVALLCVRPARSGGLSAIVSSVAVHNALVDARPDLAELFYQPWWFDRRTGDGPLEYRGYASPTAHALRGPMTAGAVAAVGPSSEYRANRPDSRRSTRSGRGDRCFRWASAVRLHDHTANGDHRRQGQGRRGPGAPTSGVDRRDGLGVRTASGRPRESVEGLGAGVPGEGIKPDRPERAPPPPTPTKLS